MFKKQVKCSECGFLGIHEVIDGKLGETKEISAQGRIDPKEWATFDNEILGCLCGQEHILVRSTSPLEGYSIKEWHEAVKKPRNCKYYYAFHPGYTPKQHLELQRERVQRRFLIIVSLLSAAVGAGIATLVNLVWS